MNTEIIQDLMDRAGQLCDAGSLAEALDLYSKVLSLDPAHHEACLMAGSIYGEFGQLDEAERLLTRAVESRPVDAASSLALAHVLRARGDSTSAIQVLERAAQSCPDDADIFCTLGGMLNESNRLADAIRHFEHAAAIDGSDARIRTTLNELIIRHADALEKSGDHERSFELIQPLLESEDPPLDAVLVFAKLSLIFETRDECRYLLKKLGERAQLSGGDRTAIDQALAWLDQG